MMSVGFEPVIPAIERLQTYTVEHTNSGISISIMLSVIVKLSLNHP